MLVLTRKTGGQLLIGADIAITILEVQGNRVRIGVVAPADVAVLRAELASLRLSGQPNPAAEALSCVPPSVPG